MSLLARRLAVSAATGGGGGFTPSDVTGLVGWFDADQITGLSNGDLIDTWQDSSGNGNHADGVSTARPTYQTGVLNGLPVVRFDGSNDALITSSVLFSGSNPRTVFVVYKSTRTGTYADPVCGNSDSASGGTWFVIQSRTLAVVGDPYLAGYSADLTGPTPDNAWKYAAASYDGTTARTRKNGVEVNSGARTLNTGSVFFRIGRDNTGTTNTYLLGDIAEILVYTQAVAGTDLTDIETYLSGKWGL